MGHSTRGTSEADRLPHFSTTVSQSLTSDTAVIRIIRSLDKLGTTLRMNIPDCTRLKTPSNLPLISSILKTILGFH